MTQATTTRAAHPLLKWAGGKTSLLPKILPRLPEKMRAYYEPFIGGGAVFFALAAEKRFGHAILSDANEELISAYGALSGEVDAVVSVLKRHATKHCERHYYNTRALDPKKLDRIARAARLIYLNRTCFNGLYRVNMKGEFNVPFGAYANPTICDEENLRAASKTLRLPNILVAGDFERIVDSAKEGDAVYFDPPYAPTSKTANFTAYVKGGFGEGEQIRLRDCFMKLNQRGVHVLLSNSDTPLARKLYTGFKIEEVEAPRRVNSKAEKRGNVGELLISGGLR